MPKVWELRGTLCPMVMQRKNPGCWPGFLFVLDVEQLEWFITRLYVHSTCVIPTGKCTCAFGALALAAARSRSEGQA